MYTNLTGDQGTQARVREAAPTTTTTTTTATTTVQMVPMVGPVYLRRGAQVCGRTVDRTCIFLLVTFGVACSMIGVVLFTSDLQMVTGFWVVGIILMLLGVVQIFLFFGLCCAARQTFNSLPTGHPDRTKLYRPVTVPSRTSSTYQLLPLRQAPSYDPGPQPRTNDYPKACPVVPAGPNVSPSPLAGQTVNYRTSAGGLTVGCATPAGGPAVGYPSSPGRLSIGGYPRSVTALAIGYPTLTEGQTISFPTSPGRRSLGYPTSPGRKPAGYSTLPGGHHSAGYPGVQTLGSPTSQRGQTMGYLSPHGSQPTGYSTLPGGRSVGYHSPRLGQSFAYIDSPRGSVGDYSSLPREHIVGYRSLTSTPNPGYLTPTGRQTPYQGQVRTQLFTSEARETSTPHGAYKRREDPPPYSDDLQNS